MPDTSKLEKLNRELEKSEKKLRKAINDEKALQHQLKQLTRKERTHRLCTRGGMLESFLQEPERLTECWLPQSWSAPNHTGDATPSPLRFGRCRANVHRTFCTPALAVTSYPFVDLPSGDTLRYKLFPADKFHNICYLFDRQ